jgi:hypothetical protein
MTYSSCRRIGLAKRHVGAVGNVDGSVGQDTPAVGLQGATGQAVAPDGQRGEEQGEHRIGKAVGGLLRVL